MPAGIDMFCAPDDEHRVALLVDLLRRAGQPVALRSTPVADPTDPCVVACTRRALAEPWIDAVFSGPGDVVAVRLDPTPLPHRCARVIDMQNWPARSADRKVASLVRWLVQHEPPPTSDGATAAASPELAARRRRRASSDGVRALAVVGMVVLVGGLLWLSASEPDGRRDAVDQALDVTLAPAPSGVQIDGGSDAVAGGAADSDPLEGRVAGGSASRISTTDGNVADRHVADGQVAGTTSQPPPPAVTSDLSAPIELPADADALAHLCNARTFEAARAWAGALNWQQRLRLPEEPCIARLLARPGFEGLEPLL